MNRLYSVSCVLLVLVLSCRSLVVSEPATTGESKDKLRVRDGQVISELGVALTPRNFPKHGDADIRDMFERGAEAGSYAAFIYQWSEPNFLHLAKVMVDLCKAHGLEPVIGLSPTVLHGLRDSLDVPKSVRNKAGRKLSFSNPEVSRPFMNAAKQLARLKPPYLCLATEINMMAFKNIQEYVRFAEVYKKLYPEIKRISPETKVFVSFQWDYMTILDDREPGKIKEHTKLVDIFRPALDVAAFTTYPHDHYSAVSDIPEDYYSRIFRHFDKKEEVMFMEIGWPGSSKQERARQAGFIERLPGLMADVKPEILIWSLLHDVKGSALSEALAATGLIANDGTAKPAFSSFRRLRDE